MVYKIDFFKGKDPDFLYTVMPELRPLKLNDGDILYYQYDRADEIYLI